MKREIYLGKPLDIVIVDGIVTDIPLTIKDKKVNFLDIIKNKAKFLVPCSLDGVIWIRLLVLIVVLSFICLRM